MAAYEMEDDVAKDLAEFALANAIYTALVEGHAAEISARRTAMENASNVSDLACSASLIGGQRERMCSLTLALAQNANDMIGTLQMQYNRGRQAVITNELIDIITVRLPFPLAICAADSFIGCIGTVRTCRRGQRKCMDSANGA